MIDLRKNTILSINKYIKNKHKSKRIEKSVYNYSKYKLEENELSDNSFEYIYNNKRKI